MSGPNLSSAVTSQDERSKLKQLERGDRSAVKWFEDEQAGLLVRKSVVAFAAGVEKVFVSSDVDWPTYHMPIWRHMGLLDASGNRKPAFAAFKTMTAQLEGFVTAERVDWGAQLHAYQFTKADRRVAVLWLDKEGNVDLSKPLHSENVEIVGLDGKRTTAQSGHVMLGRNPVFVEVK
jgi:hypothetical protein